MSLRNRLQNNHHSGDRCYRLAFNLRFVLRSKVTLPTAESLLTALSRVYAEHQNVPEPPLQHPGQQDASRYDGTGGAINYQIKLDDPDPREVRKECCAQILGIPLTHIALTYAANETDLNRVSDTMTFRLQSDLEAQDLLRLIDAIARQLDGLGYRDESFTSDWDVQKLTENCRELGNPQMAHTILHSVRQRALQELRTAATASRLVVDGKILFTPAEMIANIGQPEAVREVAAYGNKIHPLPVEIVRLKNLHRLTYSNNNLTDFPTAILSLTGLEELVLSGNKLNRLPDLGALAKLKKVDFGSNAFTELPPQLSQLTQLESLCLGGCPINSLAGIESLTHLEELILYDTALTSLPEGVRQLKNLRVLLLARTPITTLPDWILELTALKKLDAACCPLTAVPTGLRSLPNLEHILLPRPF